LRRARRLLLDVDRGHIIRSVQFTQRLREGVRSGEISCSVRIWLRPRVKIGGRYRMNEGAIEVDALQRIEYADLTPELARAAGFKGVVDLLKVAKHGRGENVYLVRFHYIPPRRTRRAVAAGAKEKTDRVRGPRAVVGRLRALGILLMQDAKLASAVAVLRGGTVPGTWWSLPDAGAIYAALERAAQHPDVLVAKLVAGKVTLIHRALWPALLAVATSREPWQLRGLSAAARRMLATLDAGSSIDVAGAPGKELERRILVRAATAHAPAGKHVTALEPWSTWAARKGCAAIDVGTAKRELEAAVTRIGGTHSLLPWAA
jgi:hypothetical protein